ncbi:MAG: cytosol aminopeptidase family, catalytic domain-containing protein [Monoraphidium minutum]|nr:MAG: cytosol aminopeptidase family, catalytic domain-containing protein [Monoraphidium minutum]
MSAAVGVVNPVPSPKEVEFEPAALPEVSVAAGGAAAAGWGGDLLVVAVGEDDLTVKDDAATIKSAALSELDASLGGVLSEVLAAGGFEGKPGQRTRAVRVLGSKAAHVALAGLGKREKAAAVAEWGQSVYQSLGTSVAALCKENKLKAAALALLAPPAQPAPAAQRVVAGALQGAYESTRFKSKGPKGAKLQSLTLLGFGDAPNLDSAVKHGRANAVGALVTRYLVEAPPNVCTPLHLADCAAHIASVAPERFHLEVLDADACHALGMGCFLGVAEASSEPAQFIHLTYKPKGEVKKKVAIVGKGLTFDSGGYNLKAGPGSMIELMKFDMGGSAATLGAARILADVQPGGVEVHFIIAACENMVAAKGLRPGDILTAASGKTVEVNNTDAEGRLTLADAMWFAQEKAGVTAMIDIATLTGACMVALGPEVAGLMTPSDDMAAAISQASKEAGEKLWRLPLEASYFDGLKSTCADMKNTAGRYGGAITAALFLKEFVNEGVEWAHMDIAGPVWNEKEGLPTGYGAATLAEWAAAQGGQ